MFLGIPHWLINPLNAAVLTVFFKCTFQTLNYMINIICFRGVLWKKTRLNLSLYIALWFSLSWILQLLIQWRMSSPIVTFLRNKILTHSHDTTDHNLNFPLAYFFEHLLIQRKMSSPVDTYLRNMIVTDNHDTIWISPLCVSFNCVLGNDHLQWWWG